MPESDEYNEEFIKKTLSTLVWNNEVCRWAIYEIKCNSEKGKILKEIFYLIYDSEKPELLLTTNNIPLITLTLIEQGFDKNLVEQVIFFLASKDLEN